MNYCDFGHNTYGTIRRLPTSRDGAIFVCFDHYITEIERRKEQNKIGAKFDLPKWSELEVYKPE